MKEKKIFNQITLLFYGILGVLMLCFIVVFLLVEKSGAYHQLVPTTIMNFRSGVLLMALAGIPASYVFHKKRTGRISGELVLEEKLKQYKISILIKLATLEGISFLCLIGYLVSADKSFLLMFGILLVTFLINIPSKSKIREELSLNEEELNF